MIYQKEITLPTFKRGFHIITKYIDEIVQESHINIGLANIFLKHTSASICINENADSTVRDDFESFFSDLADDKVYYKHTYEGSDDMPAHIKSSILSTSLNIPITNNRLNLGTWQGVYLGEHRDCARQRKLIITLKGE